MWSHPLVTLPLAAVFVAVGMLTLLADIVTGFLPLTVGILVGWVAVHDLQVLMGRRHSVRIKSSRA